MDRRAYLLTASALLLWSVLPLAAVWLAGLPVLVTTGIGLGLGGLLSAHRWREWEVPTPTRLVGVGGILGYHLLFFAAFRVGTDRLAVNLINYLWPLLIVVLAPAILPRTAWSWRHSGAALVGLAATLCALGSRGLDLETLRSAPWLGYGLAGGAAVVWACYSVLTKRLKPFPTVAVGGFCLVSGAIALVIAGLRGELVPALADLGLREGLILLALGLGPLGTAFFCWDAALKRGDPRIIGVLAYANPILSTLWLILAGVGAVTWVLGLALLLVITGAAIGTWPTGTRRKRRTSAG